MDKYWLNIWQSGSTAFLIQCFQYSLHKLVSACKLRVLTVGQSVYHCWWWIVAARESRLLEVKQSHLNVLVQIRRPSCSNIWKKICNFISFCIIQHTQASSISSHSNGGMWHTTHLLQHQISVGTDLQFIFRLIIGYRCRGAGIKAHHSEKSGVGRRKVKWQCG